MKKYFIIGAVVLAAGLALNYKFGGFKKVEPQLIEVKDYAVYGTSYQGSYKSDGLTSLVDDMRKLQSQRDSTADVVIINYIDEAKETLGIVSNFVGITKGGGNAELENLEKRIIKAKRAIRMKVNITPLAMPSPEKTKALAFEMAKNAGLELQGLSIEQYEEDGTLVIDFPIKEPATFIEQLAAAYGISNFDYNKTYSYTFNVKKGEAGVARSWKWQPSSGEVILITKGDTTIFNHLNISKNQKKLDHMFINDKYWLLFPYQLVWDTGFESLITKEAVAPISKEQVTRLTINYNSEEGYTPGDAYDFYVDNNFEIKEWSFRKGGQKEPSLTTTWEDNIIVGGIKISTNHKTEDGDFRLWFTNISID